MSNDFLLSHLFVCASRWKNYNADFRSIDDEKKIISHCLFDSSNNIRLSVLHVRNTKNHQTIWFSVSTLCNVYFVRSTNNSTRKKGQEAPTAASSLWSTSSMVCAVYLLGIFFSCSFVSLFFGCLCCIKLNY